MGLVTLCCQPWRSPLLRGETSSDRMPAAAVVSSGIFTVRVIDWWQVRPAPCAFEVEIVDYC